MQCIVRHATNGDDGSHDAAGSPQHPELVEGLTAVSAFALPPQPPPPQHAAPGFFVSQHEAAFDSHSHAQRPVFHPAKGWTSTAATKMSARMNI